MDQHPFSSFACSGKHEGSHPERLVQQDERGSRSVNVLRLRLHTVLDPRQQAGGIHGLRLRQEAVHCEWAVLLQSRCVQGRRGSKAWRNQESAEKFLNNQYVSTGVIIVVYIRSSFVGHVSGASATGSVRSKSKARTKKHIVISAPSRTASAGS